LSAAIPAIGLAPTKETHYMSAQLDQLTTQSANDPDTLETQEWLDALEAVLENEGPERAHYLMERLVDLARRRGASIPSTPSP
jgi:pyruvate dehydrogenase E1 component